MTKRVTLNELFDRPGRWMNPPSEDDFEARISADEDRAWAAAKAAKKGARA